MPVEHMDLSAESKESQLKHAEALKKFEAQQRARSIIVPTDISQIKTRLRELGQPVTLFGEGPADRRERLRVVIASLELSDEELARVQEIMRQQPGKASGKAETHAVLKETVYTAASEELIQARQQIAVFSFDQAKSRIQTTGRIRSSEQEQFAEDKRAAELYEKTRSVALYGSQFADERPLTSVRFSPDGALIASCSLGTAVKVWTGDNLELKAELKGHEERVTSLAWHPEGNSLLCSSSADASCILWNLHPTTTTTTTSDSAPSTPHVMRRLRGHVGTVLFADFHPMGRIVGTCGQDTTFRLWDIETGIELLLQDGHYKECSSLAFHKDGGLVLSTDWAGVALLWDLRSGQVVQTFQGHIKKITCSSFSPNGYQAATGSADNMVRIWDLRKKKCGYCLPAHTSVISDVRYSHSGELLLSSSFDGTLKAWGARDFQLLRSLSGHTGKIMGADVATNERQYVSAGFDRTVKLWTLKNDDD